MKAIRKPIYPVVIFLCMLGSGGCTEEVKPTPFTYSQLLTGKEKKAWRLTTIRFIDEGEDLGPINVQQQYDPCISDDLYVFYNDDVKTFEVEEGASKCDPENPDVFVENTWYLVNATSTLSFVIPLLSDEFAIPFTIRNMTDRTFTVEYFDPQQDLSYRFTFTAQND